MKIFLSSAYLKSFRKLKKKNLQITLTAKEKIALFKLNPTHPSLRLHKLQGKNETPSVTKALEKQSWDKRALN